MRILFLPNWQVHFLDKDTCEIQSPDKYVKGEPYWFFRYFPGDTNVDIIDIHKNNLLSSIEKKIKFYIVQGILAYRRQNKYDIVISHGAQSGVLLALLRRLFGNGRSQHVIFDIGGMNGARKKGISTRLIQFAMKSKPAIICHSTNIIENIRDTYPWLLKKICFVHFGVGLYQYPIKRIKEYKKEIFVFSGAKRDENTVFEAWKQIVNEKRNNGYSLCFIGTKTSHVFPYTFDIKRLQYNEYIEKLSMSSFVVIPLFDYEYSYGQMSLLGSLALGKRVIASDVGGISDYVQLCNSVRKVKEKDVEGMKQNILNYINHPSSPKERDVIRKDVEDHFNEKEMSIRIYDFIHKLQYDC